MELSEIKIKYPGKNIKTYVWIQKVIKKHGLKYDYSKVDYIKSISNIIIICPDHGEFEKQSNSHLQGVGCSKCSLIQTGLKLRKSSKQWLDEVIKIHNNKYSYPEPYIHSEQKIKIQCKEHGEFFQRPSHHLKGNGCPKCFNEKQSKTKLKSAKQWLDEVILVHNNKYHYPEEYQHSEEKIKINCPEHGEFYQMPYKHLQGCGCPKCSNIISKAEIEIIDYLKEIGINNIQTSKRNILNGKELDIYLPEHNLAIEFNGLYWHSDEYKQDNYHNLKTEQCLTKDIQLIHIFEDEWLFKKDIVKSRLKNLLKKNEFKIFARKTKIKEINSETARKFLENNHLQGFVGAKVHLGLFYTSENGKEYLVSLMNFGSLRKSLGNQSSEGSYELLRFASLKNFNIIGGANKLLKYFEKTYKPQYLLSYADRRWSNGNLYNQLNFKLSHISKPNYFYVDYNKRINRFGYRKDILISKYGCKPENTERNFCREELNMSRIYDCGNYVFHKIFKKK